MIDSLNERIGMHVVNRISNLTSNSSIDEIMEVVLFDTRKIKEEILNCYIKDDIIEQCKLYRGDYTLNGDRDRISPILHLYKECYKDFYKSDMKIKGNLFFIDDVKFSGDTLNTFSTAYGLIEKKEISVSNNFIDYSKVIHTIGNFMPLPIITKDSKGTSVQSLNQYRGISKNIRDYWDLSMVMIKKYYDKKFSNSDVEKKQKKVLDANSKWLEMFETWKCFVDKNMLNDYVDGNYEPILFWNNHNGIDVEKNKKVIINNIDSFAKIARICIIQRGLRIICKLRNEEIELVKKCNNEILKLQKDKLEVI